MALRTVVLATGVLAASATPTPAPTSAPTAAPAAPSCFAGDATVNTRYGPVMLKDLEVGESIFNGAEYDSVLGFLHSTKGEGNVLTIEHAEGELRVSSNHVLQSGGVKKAAADVVVGDDVITAAGSSRVMNIRADSTDSGLVAPLTTSGVIAVDGVQASNYATVNGLNIPHSAMHSSFLLARIAAKLGLTAGTTEAAEEMHPMASFYYRFLKLNKVLESF